MPPRPFELLSLGVLIVIIAILLVALFPAWDKIVSLTLLLYGLWVIALAGMRAKNPVKYERGAFSTLVMGILLLAIGGSWFLNILTEGNIIYSVALLLVIVGIIAVTSAVSSMRKKP